MLDIIPESCDATPTCTEDRILISLRLELSEHVAWQLDENS